MVHNEYSLKFSKKNYVYIAIHCVLFVFLRGK